MPKEVSHGSGRVETGIFKRPVAGRTTLRPLNLDGDGQVDLVNHGGIRQAVYAYTVERCDYWRCELERNDFGFGQFGENFTVEEMPEDEVCIGGDVFRVGGALAEVPNPLLVGVFLYRGVGERRPLRPVGNEHPPPHSERHAAVRRVL